MDCDTVLTYLVFNENFYIHTDARNLKLGAVIHQKGKPINFYSRKCTEPQQVYIVTERELLSVIETMT